MECFALLCKPFFSSEEWVLFRMKKRLESGDPQWDRELHESDSTLWSRVASLALQEAERELRAFRSKEAMRASRLALHLALQGILDCNDPATGTSAINAAILALEDGEQDLVESVLETLAAVGPRSPFHPRLVDLSRLLRLLLCLLHRPGLRQAPRLQALVVLRYVLEEARPEELTQLLAKGMTWWLTRGALSAWTCHDVDVHLAGRDLFITLARRASLIGATAFAVALANCLDDPHVWAENFVAEVMRAVVANASGDVALEAGAEVLSRAAAMPRMFGAGDAQAAAAAAEAIAGMLSPLGRGTEHGQRVAVAAFRVIASAHRSRSESYTASHPPEDDYSSRGRRKKTIRKGRTHGVSNAHRQSPSPSSSPSPPGYSKHPKEDSRRGEDTLGKTVESAPEIRRPRAMKDVGGKISKVNHSFEVNEIISAQFARLLKPDQAGPSRINAMDDGRCVATQRRRAQNDNLSAVVDEDVTLFHGPGTSSSPRPANAQASDGTYPVDSLSSVGPYDTATARTPPPAALAFADDPASVNAPPSAASNEVADADANSEVPHVSFLGAAVSSSRFFPNNSRRC